MKPVILAGGFGTRLWPSSREFLPKQFANLFLDGKTLFQQSVERLRKISPEKQILIIGNKIHLHIITDQLKALEEENYILCLEPESRNTFPATLLASCFFDENDTIFIAPSDHLIEYNNADKNFEIDIKNACDYANKNEKIVVFGIEPKSPETGYGYIKQGDNVFNNIFSVENFAEKPSLETAIKYLKNGEYYWNSGMFAIQIKAFLNDAKTFENQSYLAFLEMKENIQKAMGNSKIIYPDAEIFAKFRKESIDYAIIERTKQIAMIKSNFSWSDLGDWKSIAESSKNKDESGNIISENVISIKNKNSYIVNNSHIKIAAAGLENIIIIAENDSILVMDKFHAQEVKNIVNIVNKDYSDCSSHPTCENRPWGDFNTIFCKKNTKIKKLTVKPGKKLSLQSHNHRSEHWIVTEGIANVTLNEKEIEVKQNESVFIPINAKHRIENKQQQDLIIIEIQIGYYLGEDDIKRYQDDWGRC